MSGKHVTVMGSPLESISGQLFQAGIKKQLLQQLPLKLRILLPENVGDTVVSLWNVSIIIAIDVHCESLYYTLQNFLEIYNMISAWNPTIDQCKALPQKVHDTM